MDAIFYVGKGNLLYRSEDRIALLIYNRGLYSEKNYILQGRKLSFNYKKITTLADNKEFSPAEL